MITTVIQLLLRDFVNLQSFEELSNCCLKLLGDFVIRRILFSRSWSAFSKSEFANMNECKISLVFWLSPWTLVSSSWSSGTSRTSDISRPWYWATIFVDLIWSQTLFWQIFLSSIPIFDTWVSFHWNLLRLFHRRTLECPDDPTPTVVIFLRRRQRSGRGVMTSRRYVKWRSSENQYEWRYFAKLFLIN